MGPALKVCLSRESEKMTETREGQSLGVHLREVSVLHRVKQNDRRTTETKVSISGRCPPYRKLKKMTEEWQGPNLGVRFREVSVL